MISRLLRTTLFPYTTLFRSTHGNLIIGQSGGATAVINASLVGAMQAAMKDTRIDGIYGMLHGIEGLLKEDVIDLDRKSTRLNSSHRCISYAVFCLKKKKRIK